MADMQRNECNGNPTPFLWLILCLMLSVCIVALCSCTPTKHIEYVDREVVRYEKQYIHDTTFVDRHDSIYHTVYQKGDTIYDTKYVERTRYKDRIVVKTDTCYKDSIDVKYEEKVVEKEIIPKWCYYSLVGCLIFIIFAIVKVYRWLR